MAINTTPDIAKMTIREKVEQTMVIISLIVFTAKYREWTAGMDHFSK